MPESSIFMCYGSVRGESKVPSRVRKAPASGGWMELTRCTFSGSLNYGSRFAMQVSGGGDATPVVISKLTDASSTGMLREALLGTFDRNVVITFLRTGPEVPQEYLRLELQGCGLADYQIDGAGEERAVETYAIRYGQMAVFSFAYDQAGQVTTQAFAVIKNDA